MKRKKNRLMNTMYLTVTGIVLISILSCNNNMEINKQIARRYDLVVLTESFDTFYKRFNSDSVFQISRIIFPVDGYEIDENYNPNIKKEDDFHWNKSDWKIHRAIKESDDLKITTNKSDSLVVETIFIPNSGFELVRKFKLLSGKWFLIFYGEQNL